MILLRFGRRALDFWFISTHRHHISFFLFHLVLDAARSVILYDHILIFLSHQYSLLCPILFMSPYPCLCIIHDATYRNGSSLQGTVYITIVTLLPRTPQSRWTVAPMHHNCSL